MLKELRCAKFEKEGIPRPPIHFFPGLNTVIGGDNGTNSIGKSTFLMILDFVFGGDDYTRGSSSDTLSNVGPHTIQFAFKFDGICYFFSRSTTRSTEVWICDKTYHPQKRLAIQEYRNWLQMHYHLPGTGSFRNMVGRFIRVYRRQNLSETHPLRSSDKEKEGNGINALLQLFDVFSTIESKRKAAEEAKEDASAYSRSTKKQLINSASNEREAKNNVKKISELEEERMDLLRQNSAGLFDLSSFQTAKMQEIMDHASVLKSQRTKLQSQLKGIIAEEQADHETFQKNYDQLLQFFPDINIERLKDIEHFHKTLHSALDGEFQDKKQSLKQLIDLLSQNIEQAQDEMQEIAVLPNVTVAVLEEYAQKKSKISALKLANQAFFKMKELKNTANQLQEESDDLVMSEITKIGSEINREMDILNQYICQNRTNPPILTIQNANKYHFSIPNDTGTGASFRGLILFDISCLALTPLPFLVHDSPLFSQIEFPYLERILNLYKKSGKQIFIALDKAKTYTPKTQEIMNRTAILRLERGGNELFGRSWNEKKKDK